MDTHMASNVLLPRANNPDMYEIAITKSSFQGQYTVASVLVTLSLALAYYNCIEMILLIFTTFKRWKGLYFWSLTLCTICVFLYSLGMMLLYFELGAILPAKIINDLGWGGMIVFQSMVLYSRLNLIVESLTLIKGVRWMIIIISSVLITITVTLDFGITYGRDANFARAYFYIEHIQVTGFTIQEVSISGIYVWKTLKLLKVISKENTRSMIWQLLGINIIIIIMDLVIIVFQFKHLQLYQEVVKGFVYSVKLKLELNILSKLVDLVHGTTNDARSTALATIDSNTIQGQAQVSVNRELHDRDPLDAWFGADEKGHDTITKIEEARGSGSSGSAPVAEPTRSPSNSTAPSSDNEITRHRTHYSTYSTRTSGRESDILYADMLRSMR